ncbi:MAG: PqqD family peptide modification chaperone, partial [Propionibacteriaceae bacterium]|nr:PqqD family peptide modification chaperone [Propionibacteriaceae bacterium]
ALMGHTIPDDIAWVDVAELVGTDELCLSRLPSGETVLLRGTARLIWLVAVEGNDVATVVADLVGEAPEEIAVHVGEFLKELTERGLLTLQQTP